MSFARLTELLRATSFRIALGYTLLFALSFAGLGLAVHAIAVNAVRNEAITTVASDVLRLARVHERFGLRGLAAAVGNPPTSVLGEAMRYLVLDPLGRPVAGDLPQDLGGREGGFLIPPAADGEAGIVGVGLVLADGTYLAAGQLDTAAERTSRAIRDAFLLASALAALVALGGGVVASRAALGRIGRIDQTVRRIMAGDLSARVPLRGANDEIDRLTQNINGMLDRIQVLMSDLRHVTVDIAHDLRTPMGRLRRRLEEAAAADLSVDAHREVLADATEEIDRLLEVFAGLMRIAEIESKARREAFAPFDLSALATDLAETYTAVAEEAGHRLEADIAPGLRILGDRALVAQATVNLVENALRHTPEGSRIRLALARRQDRVILGVADDGPGIPLAERAAVLKPFHRLDASRTSGGNGLGLALVAAIAGLHEADLRLDDANPGLLVEIAFEAAPPE